MAGIYANIAFVLSDRGHLLVFLIMPFSSSYSTSTSTNDGKDNDTEALEEAQVYLGSYSRGGSYRRGGPFRIRGGEMVEVSAAIKFFVWCIKVTGDMESRKKSSLVWRVHIQFWWSWWW